MIRYYLDSNIYRVLKPNHPSHDPDLLHFIKQLKSIGLFIYSDAHLDDLKESQESYRTKDLELMGQYVQDNYLSRDPIKKNTSFFLAKPLEAFNGKSWGSYERVMQNFGDIDVLFEGLIEDGEEELEEVRLIKSLLKNFMDLPISAHGINIDTSAYTDLEKEMMERYIPGFSPDMSLSDMMKASAPYSLDLLSNKKEMGKLKRITKEYLKSDKYSFEKWGMQFNEKFSETGLDKSFLGYIERMSPKDQREDFYLKFSNAYSSLETLGIVTEKSGKKRKDSSLQSIMNDGNHAYFGSYADYLITDDKGLQVKANILYQLFNIPTKVLSSKDLLNQKHQILYREESVQTFVKSLLHDLKTAIQTYRDFDPSSKREVHTFKTSHTYFNYFNSLQYVSDGEASFLTLYCDRTNRTNFIFRRETEMLVSKLLSILGIDTESKGVYDIMAEANSKEYLIRKWTLDKVDIELQYSQRNWGQFICLCLYFQ